MLAVSDTGTGMEPEVLARAFDPFFTTKEEGQGTGLGLSQVFGWVKQSGGHIKIYSEVGHGTTIKLYLPRAVEEGAVAPAPAEPVPPGGDETILVVEDNANVRKTVVRQLHDLGYRSVEADSGASALKLVAEGLSNAEIADRLSLRVKTVESQLRRLFDRYDVTSRTALVRLAARQGWSEEDR